VQNVGDGVVQFDEDGCLYVDNALVTGATLSTTTLPEGETVTISTPMSVSLGQTVKVKIVTLDGTFNEASKTFE